MRRSVANAIGLVKTERRPRSRSGENSVEGALEQLVAGAGDSRRGAFAHVVTEAAGTQRDEGGNSAVVGMFFDDAQEKRCGFRMR